jgi:hypothetical protein
MVGVAGTFKGFGGSLGLFHFSRLSEFNGTVNLAD